MLSRNSVRRTRRSRSVSGMSASDSGRGDHDRGERRLGQVLEQAGEEQQDEHDRRRAHQAGDLGLRPGLLGDGGA